MQLTRHGTRSQKEGHGHYQKFPTSHLKRHSDTSSTHWAGSKTIIAMVTLSLYYAKLGNIEKALEWSEQVLSIQPNHSTALFNAGQLSRDIKEFDRAMGYAEQMIALNSTDARGYRLACAISVDKQDPNSVITYGVQGIERAPNDPNLHYLVALAYIFTQQPELGIKHLVQAKEHQSQATDISLWLGIAHERVGNTDIAIQQYEKATKDCFLICVLGYWRINCSLKKEGRSTSLVDQCWKTRCHGVQEFQRALQLCPWKHNEYHVSMFAFIHYDGFGLVCSKQYVDSTATDRSYETMAHSVSNIRSSIPF